MKKLGKRNIENILALTPMQEGMLFHYLKEPESDLYVEQLSLDINGEIDLKCFEQAWNFVIETNEMLRVVFRWEMVENPIQIILKEYHLHPGFYDFPGKRIEETRTLVEEIKTRERERKFDLQREVPFRVALCKIEKGRHEMITSHHHILYDGWSSGIILKEFFNAYTDFIDSREPGKPVKTKFNAYVKWTQDHDTEKQEKFWRDYLKGFDTQRDLSIKKRRKGKEPARTKNLQIPISKDMKRELECFVKKHKLTLASLLYSAWGILLQKYNNTDDVVFGTTVSGRSAKVQGIEAMVGLFINTLPLRIHSSAGEKIEDLLYKIENSLQQREEHEAASLVNIKAFSELNSKEALFDSIVVIENYPLDNRLRQEKGKLSVDSYSMVEMTHYDLTIGVTIFEEIEISFIYNEGVFEHASMKNMCSHFRKTIRDIVTHPDTEISDIEIITGEEKDRILYDFNNTGADYPGDKTIHQLFEEQAERTSDSIAVFGVIGPHLTDRAYMTYKELNKQSDRLAYLLREKGVGPEDIVGIMVERSIEMIIGIFGILKAGGAYLPIDPDYPGNRIKYMLADSSTGILLTTRDLSERIVFKKEVIYLESCKRFGPVGVSPGKRHGPCSGPRASQVSVSLAYIIYTSGTTGKSRGVMVDHSAVLNRLFWVKERYRLNEKDVILQAASFIFDVSVCEMFRWIPAGGKLCFLSPGDEKDPEQIVETITKYGVTTVDFVPSMLGFILDHVERQNIYEELSGLRWVFTGVEVVGINLVKRFNETLNRVNKTTLINAYGPTESTVDVTYFDCSNIRGGSEDIVPIGKPMANVRVYILDRHGGLQPTGVYGELCIAGKGLARGYLNHPELTAEKFDRDFQDFQDYQDYQDEEEKKNGIDRNSLSSLPLYPSTPLYRTGDIARWLPDDSANIEFLGRMDHQVKIRGFRVELGEVESHLLRHEKIKDGVVTAGNRADGEKYLCAYIVSGEKIDALGLKDKLAAELPDYMIPIYIVQLDKIPLTASGNVDRRALPEPELGVMEVEYTAPVHPLEEKLVSIWAEVLNIEKKAIGTRHNFFQLGGHSLKATILISRIQKELDVKVPLSEIFNFPTIKGLAGYIGTAAGDRYVSIETAEKKEYYGLSPAQRRLYVLQQMEEKRTSYNMFHVVVLKGEVSKKRLEEVFRKLIGRHESLRTSFEVVGSEPVQRVHDGVEFGIEHFGLAAKNAADREEKKRRREGIHHLVGQFVRPFDLSRAPLIRAGMIKMNEQKFLLMLDMHHIISDGTSVEIFIDEFSDLYSGSRLPDVKLQYKDFSQWQGKWFDSGGIKRQEEYWLKQFKGGVPLLNLPFDYERPPVQVFDFDWVDFGASRELTGKIRELVWETGVTLYMVLLATYSVLLAKYSDQEDIIVGTGVVGRTHPDTGHIIGMFVNMLALRSRPEGNKPLGRFLEEVKNSVLAAFENQDYPFDELVKRLNLRREYGRNPLFDTEFTFHDAAATSLEIPGLVIEPYEYKSSLLKFDLSLTAFEAEDRIHLTLGFSPRLFKRAAIENMAEHFIEILEQFPGKKNRELNDISITINHRLYAAERTFKKSDYAGFEF